MNGFMASGKENLSHGRKHTERKKIEEAIAILRDKEKAVFVDETNIEKLAALNYSGRNAEDLTDDEINQFLEKRLSIIEQSFNENSNFSYTEGEIKSFMNEAGKLTGLTVGFSEGWKVLNRDLGDFMWLVLLMVSIIIMPLRLSGSMDFYVSNEIYRFAGKTFYGLVWCPAVALILSAAMALASIWWMRLRSAMRI